MSKNLQFALALVAATAQASHQFSHEEVMDFINFVGDLGKSYDERGEFDYRLGIFNESSTKVDECNRKAD